VDPHREVTAMPLQRFNAQPVAREPGLVQGPADLAGVTELRLHGVGGTTPENLLGDVAPELVSGDRIAGFYRTADLPEHESGTRPVPRRHVEAYSWGGLTSRSGFRVLWVLLFPFALANVAGWMCAPVMHRFGPFFWVHRWFVRWAALGVTVNFLLIAAITGMDLISYQCAGTRPCATAMWWPLNRLGQGNALAHPGLRIVLGAVLPVAVIVLLAILTLRSISRYEDVQPPFEGKKEPHRRERSLRSAAQYNVKLDAKRFWDGQRSTVHLGCVHIATALALVGVLIAYTARTTVTGASLVVVRPELWTWTVRLGIATVGLALIVLMIDVSRFVAPALPVVATAVVGLGSWFAIAQPAVATQPSGSLPGMHHAADLTLTVVVGLVVLVFVPSVLGGWRPGRFFVFGPFVALLASVAVINVVMAGAVERIGELLLKPTPIDLTTPTAKGAEAVTPLKLTVYYLLRDSTPYLTLIPVAVVAVFVVLAAVRYWLVGRSRKRREDVRKEYDVVAKPAGEDIWYYSTAVSDQRIRWTRSRKSMNSMDSMNSMVGREWTARVARAQMVARLPRQLDKVLTAMAVLTVTLLVVRWRWPDWLDSHPLPSWLQTAGNWLVAAVPLALLLVLRTGWRSLDSRRHIGVIWDVITFWPRAYHPLAPPCYAERAVPELQRRLLRIHGPRTDGTSGRVVLATHSQGSVIAVAALLQRSGRPPLPSMGKAADDVALVTFGSPLGTLYGWAFPAYFNDKVLTRLVNEDSDVKVAGWVNCYYETDYIGRRVLSPKRNAVDNPLPDPITCWYVYGQPEPKPGRHSGYWSDPSVWAEVDRLSWLPGGGPSPATVGPAQPGPVPAPRHLRTDEELGTEPPASVT
jgi:hypothetical protein